MKLMSKQEAAQWLKCDPCDVDSIMRNYGVPALGSKNGRGGGYLNLLPPAVAEFEAKRAQLEGELRQLIHEAIEEAIETGGSLGLFVESLASELSESDAPQGFPAAFQKFCVELDARK